MFRKGHVLLLPKENSFYEHAPKSCLGEIVPRPICIVNGTSDQTIVFSLGEKLFNDSPQPKEFWRVEGGRHTDFLFRENFRYHGILVEWLAKQMRHRDPVLNK